MTTDLSNKSVEDLIAEFAFTAEGKVYQFNAIHLDAFNELARHLEEAQQKIVAQQAVLQEIIDIGSGNRPEVDEDCAEGRMWRIALDFSDGKDFTALTANNAKVAAEAKAEALEEAKALVLKRGEQIGGAIDPKRTAIELGLKAAEYRAKAKGEKP